MLLLFVVHFLFSFIFTMGSEVAANVLGTIGTVLWCIQLIPQIIHNYRRKSCEGLPASMMFLWALSGVPFAIYFVTRKANIPIQVQPHIFMALALITLGQCMYYPPIGQKLWKVVLFVAVTVCTFAGIEAGCLIPFKHLYADGVHWPVTLVGIIAAVLLGVGLLPPYWELYKRNGEVVGINFIFLTIDSLGALVSIFSLAAQTGDFDLLGCILYVVILVLEGGIFASQGIWLLRNRKERRELKRLEQIERGECERSDGAVEKSADGAEPEVTEETAQEGSQREESPRDVPRTERTEGGRSQKDEKKGIYNLQLKDTKSTVYIDDNAY